LAILSVPSHLKYVLYLSTNLSSLLTFSHYLQSWFWVFSLFHTPISWSSRTQKENHLLFFPQLFTYFRVINAEKVIINTTNLFLHIKGSEYVKQEGECCGTCVPKNCTYMADNTTHTLRVHLFFILSVPQTKNLLCSSILTKSVFC